MYVVVAIPNKNDPVWKVSSEPVPHMTLLALGDSATPEELMLMAEFIDHATEEMLTQFGMMVERRDLLGPDDADVLFFEDDHIKNLKSYRKSLLQNPVIKKAYMSMEQYPEWTPHLTLGYPAAPAHDDAVEHPIGWVSFDKISLWTGDYTGPEFVLDDDRYDGYDEFGDVEVSMSGVNVKDYVSHILEHHGVKGMRWGQRKSRESAVTITAPPGKKAKASGGFDHPAHQDALNALKLGQQAKASSVHSLSNQELQHLITRMNLESQYVRLASPGKNEGQKFLEQQLRQIGQQKIQELVKQQANK